MQKDITKLAQKEGLFSVFEKEIFSLPIAVRVVSLSTFLFIL